MSCLLLEHVGCTPLGYYVGSPQPSQSQGDVGCGWDELLRADMRTCQTGLAAASLRTHRQMKEKVGETDERWFLFSPTTSGWTFALAVLFWLSSVVSLCPCLCLFSCVRACVSGDGTSTASRQAAPARRQDTGPACWADDGVGCEATSNATWECYVIAPGGIERLARVASSEVGDY